jgi:hypothetical protein
VESQHLFLTWRLQNNERGLDGVGYDRSGMAKSEMSDDVTQGGAIMQQRTTRVNPSEETITIGPLGIRFLLTGDDSNGSASVFEVLVPGRAEAGSARPHERRLRGDALRY